jgi:hypothetical protein
MPRPAALRATAAFCACAAVALIAAACAAPLKIAASADPLAVLGRGSLVYARLGGEAAREFAASALGAPQAKSLKPVLARTRLVALGLGALQAAGSSKAPTFQACLVGDYPFRAAAMSLGADPAWKREKGGYFNAGLGLRASVPGPGLVLASTGSLEPLLASAKAPGPSPIPPELDALASRELVVWVPEPFSGLAAALLGEPMDLPVRGLLISASPVAGDPGQPGGYEATIVFLMENADSARVYRPVLRLAWQGIARLLFGDAAGGALAASFTVDGDKYLASGVRMPGAAALGASTFGAWLTGFAQ